ncbi:hypothetical protein ABC345_21055 [Shouchella sp. 1P09AA]|uniref:hypothetical protein n=1 Tax=unclassified Shouchella TaxID=2893065 RepID=UPI0039A3C3B6
MNKKTLISWNAVDHPDIDQKIEDLRQQGRGAISQYVRLALKAYMQLEEEGATNTYMSSYKPVAPHLEGSSTEKKPEPTAPVLDYDTNEDEEEYTDATALFARSGLL